MFTACVVFVILPLLWVISQVIFLVWTKVMHVMCMRLLQYIISRYLQSWKKYIYTVYSRI